MATHPDVLTVTAARKRFGDVAALDGATLSLREGELLALLGPNGAGKTTLIRAIAGRVRLDAGEIRLFDKPLDGSPHAAGARHRAAGARGLSAAHRAREPRSVRPAAGTLARRSGRAASTGRSTVTALDDRADEPVKQFSGGMKRRLNIACGVLHRPRVVLLDEPTVGVDPQSRERIYDMLAELTRDGRVAAADDAPSRRGRGALFADGDHRPRDASSRPARWPSSSIRRSAAIGS